MAARFPDMTSSPLFPKIKDHFEPATLAKFSILKEYNTQKTQRKIPKLVAINSNAAKFSNTISHLPFLTITEDHIEPLRPYFFNISKLKHQPNFTILVIYKLK